MLLLLGWTFFSSALWVFFISKFNHSQKYLISCSCKLQSIFHDHLFRNYFFPKCNQRNFPYKISCCFNYNELYSTIQYLITCITVTSFGVNFLFLYKWVLMKLNSIRYIQCITFEINLMFDWQKCSFQCIIVNSSHNLPVVQPS